MKQTFALSLIGAGELQNGVALLAEDLGITQENSGLPVFAHACPAPTLDVLFGGTHCDIFYQKKCHFFRGLTLLAEALHKGQTDLTVHEQPQFATNGIMFDLCHANGAFNKKTMFYTLRKLAMMGLDTCMMYLEDNIEVPGQPYVGYMRPTYPLKELREYDDYAFALGIEMYPCIQTLAHLEGVLRWSVYKDITDYPACLLVGEDATYKFIEDLIVAASSAFRSKKIHIGMDEAWQLGSGQFLRKHGYVPPIDIMKAHLPKVNEIVKKHGLIPLMWDDMFFAPFGEQYYDKNKKLPPELSKAVPDNMNCVFWYYGDFDEREGFDIRDLLDRQFELTKNIVYAGGCWAWFGYGLAFEHTLSSSVKALQACKEKGVKDVFITTWGDHGAEIMQTVNLVGAQIYAECGYADEFDYEKFADHFAFITGGNVEDFRLLDAIDNNPYTVGQPDSFNINTSRQLMWQDPLCGLLDKNFEGLPMNAHYAALAEKLKAAETRNGDFNDLFRMSRRMAEVLAVKAEIGIRLKQAYKAGDKALLAQFAHDLADLKARVEALHEEHRFNWYKIYKPIGWDVADIHYGGLIARLVSAERTVSDYLNGKIDGIEELEVERLPYQGVDEPVHWLNNYARIASASEI